MRFLIAAGIIAVASASVAQSVGPAPVLLVKDILACKSAATMERGRRIAVTGDQEASTAFIIEQVKTGECLMIPKSRQIYIVQPDKAGQTQIRAKGDFQELWTPTLLLKSEN